MKNSLIKSISTFLLKIVGKLYNVANKHADSVVMATEWVQGILEGNEEKARKIVESTKTKFDDKVLDLAIKELPSILKGTKEVQELVDGTEDVSEFWDKIKGNVVLEAKEKRKFYTDIAAELLVKFVSVPHWVAIIITQFAFGRIFKA